jgi:c-di-GMP-binding flagellar brake protein YcgR
MGKGKEMEEAAIRPRVGIVNFEKRGHPRFKVDLPIEYFKVNSSTVHIGRVINASEGGLLVTLPEEIEIGQDLQLKLFFISGSEMNTIEMLIEVVWRDIHLGNNWGDYRYGVKFVDISPHDLNRLKNFLMSLSK